MIPWRFDLIGIYGSNLRLLRIHSKCSNSKYLKHNDSKWTYMWNIMMDRTSDMIEQVI